jgi:hypothetical protein
MRLLYTNTLYIWDNSTLVMLCFYGDLMEKFYFINNMLQLLSVALPLKLGALHLFSLLSESKMEKIFHCNPLLIQLKKKSQNISNCI